MKITIIARKQFGRLDCYVLEPELRSIIEELTGRPSVRLRDVEILESLGVECFAPDYYVCSAYAGPKPTPAKFIWGAK